MGMIESRPNTNTAVSCTHRNQPAIGYKVPLFPHWQCLHRSDVPYRYWSCTSIVVTGFQYSHTSSGYRYLMFPYQQCNSYRVPIPVVATRFQFSHTDCGHRVPFQQWLQDTNLFSQIVATACSIITFVFTYVLLYTRITFPQVTELKKLAHWYIYCTCIWYLMMRYSLVVHLLQVSVHHYRPLNTFTL